MKRFLAKIGRFFWSWGFLKLILWAVTLIALFYVEEDWRGAHMWAQTKAKWEAKGESFDFTRFIPPPIPDSENLAAIPLFKLEPDLKNKGDLAPLVLQRALQDGQPASNLRFPNSGNWMAGRMFDMKILRDRIATAYVEAFRTPPPNDSMAQFETFYPFVADLRRAAETRPYCRFLPDYPPQSEELFHLFAAQLVIVNILDTDALLALDAHKPDLALDDIKINFKIISGLRQEPSLPPGLIAVAMNAIGGTAIYNGLALHSWNEAQIADLQSELAKTDFLADYQLSLRGSVVTEIYWFDNFKVNRAKLGTMLKENRDNSEAKTTRRDFPPAFWPDGWLDLNEAQIGMAALTALNFFDLKSRVVFPKRIDLAAAEAERQNNLLDAFAPWNIFFDLTAPVLPDAAQRFSRGQVWVDEMTIACALERYHLAHGIYPATLDELAPAYIDEVPHDVINGQPYRYRLRADGTFLLYSVGWNQIDDGGKVVYKKDAPMRIDDKEGDWVWPTLK